MITQKALRLNATLKKYVIGAHPIIQYFIDRLQLREIVGSLIAQDHRIALSVEKIINVMIHNILASPRPMYEFSDWSNPLCEESIGLELFESGLIQDDRIGNALDSFYEGKHKDVFFRLALRAIKVYNLDCSRIHQDTTTITFSGKYAGSTIPEHITHGHNKDHRPDLKQLVVGLSVTADGSVPLVHKIYAGNKTDDRLHVENHLSLRRLLNRTDFVYVADCKLATEENLSKISGCGGIFVTVMPRSWKEDKEFRDKLRDGKIHWDPLLKRKNNRKPSTKTDHYSLAHGEYKTKQEYRLFWVQSTQKAEQDAETRQRQIETALEAMRCVQSKLNRYQFKKRKSIEHKLKNILKENHCNKRIHWQLHVEHKYKINHKKRGRPKSKESEKKTWTPHYSLSFSVNAEEIEQEIRTDGVFPLITNAPEKEFDPKRVLEIYKFQPFLEKRHAYMKTWQEAAPVSLKKPERVVAYLHVHVMSLMVGALIERSLRQAMHKNKIAALPLYLCCSE